MHDFAVAYLDAVMRIARRGVTRWAPISERVLLLGGELNISLPGRRHDT
jgi:hypothetical protein